MIKPIMAMLLTGWGVSVALATTPAVMATCPTINQLKQTALSAIHDVQVNDNEHLYLAQLKLLQTTDARQSQHTWLVQGQLIARSLKSATAAYVMAEQGLSSMTGPVPVEVLPDQQGLQCNYYAVGLNIDPNVPFLVANEISFAEHGKNTK